MQQYQWYPLLVKEQHLAEKLNDLSRMGWEIFSVNSADTKRQGPSGAYEEWYGFLIVARRPLESGG